ncbi:MAG TPA: carboxypeptidase regulatory-like domain-containing protein, partial [Thermodesulfobacteriota bacterium]|nr:carboxypeptidase regulatory-like domain-containing protein [Thermodesulfobacteriota bacterium]
PFHVLRYTDGVNLNPRNIRGGSLDVEDATTFTIFQEENATLAVDQLPMPKKDFLARQTGSQQFGTIHGKVKDSSGKSVLKGSLVLWEGIQGKIIPFEDGIYSLLGLNDGDYRVTIRAEGYGEVEKNLQARKGEVKEVDLVLPPRRTPQPPPSPKTNPPARTKP